MSLLLLLTAHFIADFYLQSDDCSEKKIKKFRYLARHALMYALVFAIILFLCIPCNVIWLPFLIVVLSHFFIDWIRICIDRKRNTPKAHLISFLIDQTLHIAIICTIVFIFELNVHNRSWLSILASNAPLEQILRYVLIFTIILDPASIFVKKLSCYVSGNASQNTQEKDAPVGSIIGKFERILTVILVLFDEIGAIGFVLAAKSLARYKQLDDKKFAEKYLVGTLSSTTIAIIVALLLK